MMNKEELKAYEQRKFAEFEQLRLKIANDKVVKSLNGERTYMAYLDLDGFKEKLYQNSDKLFLEFQKLLKQIIYSYIFGVVQLAQGEEETEVNYFDKILAPKIFSDSIFIPTIDDSEEAFSQLSTICSIIMVKSILMGLTCRGAISAGNTYLDPQLNIVLGKSVAKSAEIASKLQTFGVAIDPELIVPKSSTTEELKVKIKSSEQMKDVQYRFARVSAFIPHQMFDINREYPIQEYDKILKDYKNRTDAKPKIKDRYDSGRLVLIEMLK